MNWNIKILNLLSSVKIFIIMAALVLAACFIGGVLPQGLQPREYEAMFGQVAGLLVTKSGLSNVFSSVWFLMLMTGAAVNLLACTVKQWKFIRLRPGVFLTHLAMMLVFSGAAVRGIARVSGTMSMETGETRAEFEDAAGKIIALPFAVSLKDFRVTYWEEEKHFIHAVGSDAQTVESVEVREGGVVEFKTVPLKIKVVRFYPHFSIGPAGPFNSGESRMNPALTIVEMNEKPSRPQYLFARYPDYHGGGDRPGVRLVYELRSGKIKQFESHIVITEDGALKHEKTISVNSPAHYRGYRLYQAGYDADNPEFSGIQVAKDPSVNIIYSGFALLMAGLTLAFWKEIKQ